MFTHIDSFLPTDYKVCMIYTLAYQCFKSCSDWTRFHQELKFLKHVFLENGYPLLFIDKCFKMVINKLVIKHPQVTTVEKRTLILWLPYPGNVSLQTRAKSRKSFKGILNSCKLQSALKSQKKKKKRKKHFANVLSHQKRVQLTMSIDRDHLLNCSNIPSFNELTILEYVHHKYILEINESLLIKCDRPVLRKNISSAKLFLFDN